MATMKRLNEAGAWIDYVEEKQGILTFNGSEWVDGASDEIAPPIAVATYDGAKWVRFYPNAYITYQHKITGSGLKFTHTKNSTSTWGNDTTSGKDSKAGVWTSGAVYTGWLGIKKPTSIAGGIGNIDEIMDITCNFTRRGVGYWENPLKLQLVPSTLTGATGTGTNAHNSKRGSTIYSDTDMPVCTGTGALSKGSTTFNNANAKTLFKSFLNGSYNSILLGQKESKGDFIAVTEIELIFTYTCKVAKATFSDSRGRSSNEDFDMLIYENEIGMTYDEIIEHRRANNIKDINPIDVIFE